LNQSLARDYRLALVDLDGTLLDSRQRLTVRASEVLNRVDARGVRVVLASGRPTQSIVRFVSSLRHPVIVPSNGGALIDLSTGDVRIFGRINLQSLGRLVELAGMTGAAFCAHTPTEWYAEARGGYIEIEVERSGTAPQIAKLVDLEGPVIKAMAIGDRAMLSTLEDALSRSTVAEELYWFRTYPDYLEIMPRGVSKAGACREVCQKFGIPRAKTIAIGDGENDLEMLQVAGTRVAVANAHPDVLALADLIAPSNDEEGAAWALSALILGSQDAWTKLTIKRAAPSSSRESSL
jgi:Cof subfamily protein (haloacid dehalogenase superfamily)